jgi:PAS domain S-box-containing protein
MDELLNKAPCGFLVFTDDGKIAEANQTLLDLLGYARHELENLNIEKLFSVAGRIFYQTHFFPLLKLHNKVEEIYFSLRAKEGSDIPVLASAARQTRGGMYCNDCIFMPMFRRNRFEEEILKAKKEAEAATLARDEFLSVVSHELRTPLNAILGWTKILQAKGADNGTLARAVAAIERSAAAQKLLVEDILDFERITTGKLTLQIERLNLPKAVENTVEIVAPAASVKEIRLETEIMSGGCVAGDRDRLQQAFWNLLSNAVKFTPAGGEVSVSVRRAASLLQVAVRDNGLGIKPEFLPHVFERFRQGDASETKRHSGLGLGLAITRHIVELHGGTIEAESAGENQGATFTVSLPLVD